jgi:trimeric autotransporter adhesin
VLKIGLLFGFIMMFPQIIHLSYKNEIMKILSILSIAFVFCFSLNAQNWNQVVKNAASDRDGFSGYFSADGGRTLDIAGTLNSGSVSIPITNTSSGDPLSDGWNFIGNPFASPVDFDLIIQSAPASVEDALYRWNPVLEQYVAYVDQVSSSSSFNSIIPSMQGFWVKTSASTNLVLDASMRVQDPAVNGTFLKSGSDNNPLFRLQLNGQGYSVESVVRYKPNATNFFDSQFDAHYLSSDVPGSPEFATVSNLGPLTINTRLPLVNTPDLISLHCIIATDGIYSISLTELSNFNQNDLIILEDVLLGTTHVLNQSAYTFIGSTLDAAGRFNIRVVPAMMTSVDEVLNDEKINIFRCNDNLCINLSNAFNQPQLINIYNKVGQLVFSSRLESGLLNYSLNNLNLNPSDIYLVKLESMDSAVKLKW